jgi:hypothetical protein
MRGEDGAGRALGPSARVDEPALLRAVRRHGLHLFRIKQIRRQIEETTSTLFNTFAARLAQLLYGQ